MTTPVTPDTEIDFRALIEPMPDGVKCCAVCGKPGSRNHGALNAVGSAHAQVIAGNVAGRFASLSRSMGKHIIEAVQQKVFNAQLEVWRSLLIKARREHDAYVPVVGGESEKSMLIATCTQTLSMLGIKVDGTHTPLALADAVQIEVGKLLLALDNAGIKPEDFAASAATVAQPHRGPLANPEE